MAEAKADTWTKEKCIKWQEQLSMLIDDLDEKENHYLAVQCPRRYGKTHFLEQLTGCKHEASDFFRFEWAHVPKKRLVIYLGISEACGEATKPSEIWKNYAVTLDGNLVVA
jgi:hypothetical protein